MKVLRWTMLLWAFCAGIAFAQTPGKGITVMGEGSVASPPDMARISLGVMETADTAKEAMTQVSEKVSVILSELDTLGIAKMDRQTSGFYLRPILNRPEDMAGQAESKIVGYQAGNSVTVRVRNLDVIGEILDGVIDIGANNFDGLSFGLKDSSDAMAKARALAVADAMARAKQLADAAGLQLGPVIHMSESSYGAPAPMMEMASLRGAASNAIAGGEVDVSARVTMVFDILPKR